MLHRRWKTLGFVLLALAYLAGCSAPTLEASGSPEATVTQFYAWYNTIEGSPLGSRAYRNSEFLSEGFIHDIDDLVDTFADQGGAFDPFICAQDGPSEITVIEVEGTADRARVTVQAWTPIYVDLALVDWQWQIVDIHCSLPD